MLFMLETSPSARKWGNRSKNSKQSLSDQVGYGTASNYFGFLGNWRERNMLKQERIFSISNNNKGLWCPFKASFCQEGYCPDCQVYLDYQRYQITQVSLDYQGHQITMGKTASLISQWLQDWEKEQGEIVVICGWCGKEMGRKPGLGETGVSHGICDECKQEVFS